MIERSIEYVAVHTRVRLARNFADYPFPNRLKTESASEIVDTVTGALLGKVEDLTAYDMDALPPEEAEFLFERNMISRALIQNKRVSAALIACDESVSIMLNEEDHVREQVFMLGYDLRRAYERLVSIDEDISQIMPYAFDDRLGYLTSCPTNLGTGMRASVMLFLPGLARLGKLKSLFPKFKRLGLTIRGAFGEGSGAEGYMYQLSNEITLGVSEEEILTCVENAVELLTAEEWKAREELLESGGIFLIDKIMRAYGVLSNCMTLNMSDFLQLITEVKIGVCLGVLSGDLTRLDALLVDMRPANLDHLNGTPLIESERDVFRAEHVHAELRAIGLLTEERWEELYEGGKNASCGISE